VDYSGFTGDLPVKNRFAVIYIFYSFIGNLRVKVRAFISDDNLEIDSICPEFKGADWPEREVYDMYGIVFRGHPGLKRILMPDYYEHYPLRKDYPLKGLGERSNFPKHTIYDKLNRD
jgi:NADH-quinone oxidoreductase subunit C